MLPFKAVLSLMVQRNDGDETDIPRPTGSNQVAIRIGLLRCLVDVDTDDEQWDDALANTSLIHELQDSLPGRQALPLERRIEREQKLALLYDRAGDAATAQHLVRSLLLRANVLHATNPYL